MDQDTVQRDEAALALWIGGYSLRDIAARLGFPGTQAAFDAVRHQLGRRASPGDAVARAAVVLDRIRELGRHPEPPPEGTTPDE